MQKLILTIALISLFFIPFVSADVLRPGYKGIGINNIITNINDFPDYVFFTVGEIGPSMCPIQVIGIDGIIPSMYKFCTPSVYAIKKSEFNLNYVKSLNQNELNEYVKSQNIKKVIDHVYTFKEVQISSTEQSITQYYTINLEGTKENPTNIATKRNNLFYIYTIVPIIALLIIIFLIFKKRK